MLDFFQLREQPFGATPDPRYLYLGPAHREALDLMEQGVASATGLTTLIAEPGMGKTTLLFDFLSKAESSTKTAFLFQPQLTAIDLFRGVLEELGIRDESGDIGQMQRRLNDCLIREFSAGKKVLVVVDEAQCLDDNVLESVRLLSNIETPTEKLMHIIIAGQPALAATLASERLTQLRQRISMIVRLTPFDEQDTGSYIDHRLSVAGYDGKTPIFTKKAVETIAYHSGGIPRNINTLCFHALSRAATRKTRPIEPDAIEEVVKDLDLQSIYEPQSKAHAKRPATPIRPSVSNSVFSRWWLRVALILIVMGGLGGVLVRAKWHPLHPAIQTKVQALEPASLPPAVPVSESEPESARNSTPAVGLVKIHQVEHVETPLQPPAAPSSNRLGNSSRDSIVVTVRRNQTIFRICMEKIGRYNNEIATRIRELNPNLGDFAQIKVGQEIRLPLDKPVAKTSRVAAAQAQATAVGAEKP